MTDPEYIDPSELRPGPIRHASLPPELLEYIEAVYHMIGPYLNTTLEQFEIGFMRDAHPAREVAVWCGITAAWVTYHNKYLGGQLLPDADETKLTGALAAISAGVTDAALLCVPVEVGHRLLECYDELEER
ncbi:MAG: hypothetical protein ACYC4U_30680 [Pirellulaceae bacterium]